MPSTVAVYLDAHCKPSEKETFLSACRRVADREDTSIVSLHTGEDLSNLARSYPRNSIKHLVIAAHGGTTWILDDKHGLTTGTPLHQGQDAVHRFCRLWAPQLAEKPLISLAACMCSRAPAWFLRRITGYVGSDWGPRGYLPGGQASISARIRDFFYWYGVDATVRGHRTLGHATYNPILAQHWGMPGAPCESWWALENPGKYPTLAERRSWVKSRKGQPAEAWLMGWYE